MPEFVLGTAVSSSKASVETQLQPFIKWIEKKRGLAGRWMQDVSRVVLAYAALTDWRIDPATGLEMHWKALTESDGRLTLDTVTWAHGAGIIDNEGARRLLAISTYDLTPVPPQFRRGEKRRAFDEWDNLGFS